MGDLRGHYCFACDCGTGANLTCPICDEEGLEVIPAGPVEAEVGRLRNELEVISRPLSPAKGYEHDVIRCLQGRARDALEANRGE